MEKDNEFILAVLSVTYFFVGVVVKVVLYTECDISLLYLILSSALVIIFCTIFYHYKFKRIKPIKVAKYNRIVLDKSKINNLRVGVSIFCLCACAMSYNYIFLFNACFSLNDEIYVSGVVSELNIVRGKKAKYYISLVETNLNRQLKLQISKEEYKSLSLGAAYSRKWRIGSFGILYWKKWEKL
ncbi:MAG: hypothetical protein V4732_07725 [Pseudomonadota bacterium]